MRIKKEQIPVFEKVQTGTKEKIVYIASDDSEHFTELACKRHEESLKLQKEYEEVCKRMRVKIFESNSWEQDLIILRTTTIEDLNKFENYYSDNCHNTPEKSFEPNKWFVCIYLEGNDYKDSFHYEPYEYWLEYIDKVLTYVEKENNVK